MNEFMMDMDFLEIPVSGWTCARVGLGGVGQSDFGNRVFVSEVDDDEEGLSYFNVLNNITMRNTQCGD